MEPHPPNATSPRMSIEYMVTLEDITESQIRHYLRSKAYAAQRLSEPFFAALAGLVIFYVFSISLSSHVWWGYLVTFVSVFFLISLTTKGTVSDRIRKQLKRELGPHLPAPVIYEVTDSQLSSLFRCVTVTYPLESLLEIREEAGKMEIFFDQDTFANIPLRAFRDDTHKSKFIGLLKREHPSG